MKKRIRQRVDNARSGSAGFVGPGLPVLRNAWCQYSAERIEDWTEKKKDIYGLLPSTELRMHKVFVTPPIVSGASGVSSSAVKCDMSVSYYSVSGPTTTPQFIPIPPPHISKDKGNTQYTNELLDRTNPFRYEYSIPVGLKEMAELLTLFKLGAKTLLGLAGSTYLTYRFGAESLARDLKTIVNLTEVIESRIKEMKSILDHGGLRRKAWLDTYVTPVELGLVQTNSSPSPVSTYHTVSRRFRTKVWGTVRWFPAPGAYQYLENTESLTSFVAVARRVLDLEGPDFLTAWELIPFSWLIDYFYDISSYLGATRRSGVVTPEYINIIRRTEMEEVALLHSVQPGFSCTSGRRTQVIVSRDPIYEGAEFPTSLPVITLSEAKAIAALLANFKR